MRLPANTGGNTGPRNNVVPRISPPSFVKTFASPGVDSPQEEFGVFASGAGTPNPKAKGFKIFPWDWQNDAPEQGPTPGKFIGNFAATQAKPAHSMSVRRRGVSPWGGSALKLHPHSMQHTGGNQDMNPGADYQIAGGQGQASSFVRIQSTAATNQSRGMKLPVLPQATTRGGMAAIPAGGTFDGSPAPPLMPRVNGWATVFAWKQAPAKTTEARK